MYNKTATTDSQARAQLQELFRGHPELLTAAFALQTRKERADFEAKEKRFMATVGKIVPGKPTAIL